MNMFISEHFCLSFPLFFKLWLFGSICFQHYTKDADGLCTRLIKPKLEEGAVAAQDEFSRSRSWFISRPCNNIH